jgi:hypothetical protein
VNQRSPTDLSKPNIPAHRGSRRPELGLNCRTPCAAIGFELHPALRGGEIGFDLQPGDLFNKRAPELRGLA